MRFKSALARSPNVAAGDRAMHHSSLRCSKNFGRRAASITWVKAVLAQCLASLFECGVAYLHLRIGFDVGVERHDTTEQPSKCWRMMNRQKSQVAD